MLPKVVGRLCGVIAVLFGTRCFVGEILPNLHAFDLILAHTVDVRQLPFGQNTRVMFGVNGNGSRIGLLGVLQFTGGLVAASYQKTRKHSFMRFGPVIHN